MGQIRVSYGIRVTINLGLDVKTRPVARPAGGGAKLQNEIFRHWRELGGGRTWKKWTKYILAEQIFLKKGHFDKIFGILPSWGGQGPPGPPLATGLMCTLHAHASGMGAGIS